MLIDRSFGTQYCKISHRLRLTARKQKTGQKESN
jgi:hypothetical protein